MRPRGKMVITFILAIHLLSFQQGITQDAEGPNTIRHSISQALSIEASDPTTALQYLSKAIVQAEKSQDRGLLIEACLIKARILVKADNLEEALLTANRALILALEVGRESQVEQAYFLLSNIYLSKDLVSESF
jgi:tetratricopeptide (TPR) repeat protein